MFKINGNLIVKILENVIKKINEKEKYTFNKIKNIILEELNIIKKNYYNLNNINKENENIDQDEEEKPIRPIRKKNKRTKIRI